MKQRRRDSGAVGLCSLHTRAERGSDHTGVTTRRRAPWMAPARREHRKMLYDANCLHFIHCAAAWGNISNGLGAAGPAHAQIAQPRRDQKRCHGITSGPSIWYAQLGRRSPRTHPSLRSHWTCGWKRYQKFHGHCTSGSDVEYGKTTGWNSHPAGSAERALSRGLNRRRSSWFGTWPIAQD